MLRTGFNLLVASFLLWVGTILLMNRQPNAWISSGLAVILYSQAFDYTVRAVRERQSTLPWRLQVRWTGYLAGACLCGVGSAMHGGAIGILGAIGAAFGSVFCLWLLQQLAKARSLTSHGSDATDSNMRVEPRG